MPRPDQGRDTQKERKSLTHRLDLGGVATPRPRKSNGSCRKAQKGRKDGHKRTEPGDKSSHHVKENDVMSATTVEQQVAAAAEQVIGGGLENFKGLDVKVRVQKSGTDWGKVGETACYAGIAVGAAAVGTAAVLGTASLLGYGPSSDTE